MRPGSCARGEQSKPEKSANPRPRTNVRIRPFWESLHANWKMICNNGRRVRGLAIPQGRLEIESAQPRGLPSHPDHDPVRGRLEARELFRMLRAQLPEAPRLRCACASFIGVDGSRLGKNFRRHDSWQRPAAAVALNGWRGSNVSISETRLPTLLPVSVSAAAVSCSNPVAESRAGHYAARAFRASGSVAVAGTGGHIEIRQLRDIDGSRLRCACAGTPLGSPKPPVCTFCGAALMVCGAELPVENTLVCTIRLGIAGALVAEGSGLEAAILTSAPGLLDVGFGLRSEERADGEQMARVC